MLHCDYAEWAHLQAEYRELQAIGQPNVYVGTFQQAVGKTPECKLVNLVCTGSLLPFQIVHLVIEIPSLSNPIP